VLILLLDSADAERGREAFHASSIYPSFGYYPTRLAGAPVIDPDQAVGEVIREARKAADLSQTELADALGWQQRKISEIESGKQPASLKELDRIAGVLKQDALDWVSEAFKRSRRSPSK
jgi:DNA-binding XRE family transcriptional regulator